MCLVAVFVPKGVHRLSRNRCLPDLASQICRVREALQVVRLAGGAVAAVCNGVCGHADLAPIRKTVGLLIVAEIYHEALLRSKISRLVGIRTHPQNALHVWGQV